MGGGHFHQSEFSQKEIKKNCFENHQTFLVFDIFPKSIQKMNIYIVTNRIITPIHVSTFYKHFILHVTKINLFLTGIIIEQYKTKYTQINTIFLKICYNFCIFLFFFIIFSHNTYFSVTILKTKHMQTVTWLYEPIYWMYDFVGLCITDFQWFPLIMHENKVNLGCFNFLITSKKKTKNFQEPRFFLWKQYNVKVMKKYDTPCC